MASSCAERDLSQIVSIKAYSIDKLHVPAPVFTCAERVDSGDLTIDNSGVVTVGFSQGSVSIEDKVARNIAGTIHTVTVEWETANPLTDNSESLAKLRHSPHHLLIEYFGGFRQIVRTCVEGYSFDNVQDGTTQKCTMVLMNGQGVTSID